MDRSDGWRRNAISFTNRYIGEGLRDRALTRDLDWGGVVPAGELNPEILFQRLDKKVSEIESEKLKAVLEGNG